jgi:archaemetzincin
MGRPGFLAIALIAVTCSWGAFKRPTETDCLQALGNLQEESTVLQRLLTPDDNFFPITPPRPGDWLSLHFEPGQTFEQYRQSHANRPDTVRHIIYLLPIGEFTDDISPTIEQMRMYAAAFFQMEVKILPPYFPHDLEFSPRKNSRSGQRQLLTTEIMDLLKLRIPADGYCLLGITMADLYPRKSWNFVFGEASLEDRVGVYSFARYDPAFEGSARPDHYRDLILQRGAKVLVHEACHMFGLHHCIYYDCVVNGSNSMVESDTQPQHLCPVCLRKLSFITGFDIIKRYEDLAHFYHRQKWFDESDWAKRQLQKARH